MTRPPRICHFSSEDQPGGAASAAFRLHRALVNAGADSRLYVREKRSSDPTVWQVPPRVVSPWRDRAERWWRRSSVTPSETFNLDEPPRVDLASFLAEPDSETVLIFHWIDRFLDVEAMHRLALHCQGPVLWVLHDQEPLTGGCHYSYDCEGYQRACGSCPQLGSERDRDRSRRTWQRKRDLLANLPLTFLATTAWGEARVRESSLFRHHRVERIPLPLDPDLFRPFSRRTAREVLRLPEEPLILFFGASYLDDRRKGLDHLRAALHHVKVDPARPLRLLIAGERGGAVFDDLPFPVDYLGPVRDPLLMALAYQASDFFVCPTLADSGPLMIPEAMLCERPVVAYRMG
ncbi:MAG: glycosyltransferase, partial [Blastocatellia bacterium]